MRVIHKNYSAEFGHQKKKVDAHDEREGYAQMNILTDNI